MKNIGLWSGESYMSFTVIETTRRSLPSDGKQAVFILESLNDDAFLFYRCRVVVSDVDNNERKYTQWFLKKDLDKLYSLFIDKFCNDPIYRVRFDDILVAEERLKRKQNPEIDERLVELIAALNAAGVQTLSCCQGNINEQTAHQETAYIKFALPFPDEMFRQLNNDARLHVSENVKVRGIVVRCASQKYNQQFPQIIEQALLTYFQTRN